MGDFLINIKVCLYYM